jgi:hypothetical protein
MITTQQADRLAVCYHAYMKAFLTEDFDNIIYWGPLLLEAQDAVGSALLAPHMVDQRVREAHDLKLFHTKHERTA